MIRVRELLYIVGKKRKKKNGGGGRAEIFKTDYLGNRDLYFCHFCHFISIWFCLIKAIKKGMNMLSVVFCNFGSVVCAQFKMKLDNKLADLKR